MKKITIIPARSGSKGLKNKNILNLGGVPMFAWSIIHSNYYSKNNDLTIVSSDSDEYLSIAEEFGATPHKRSEELAKDETFTEPVMEDVLDKYEVDANDIVILLQPTSPIRSKSTIDKFINALENEKCDSALTLTNYHGFHWKDDGEFKLPLYKNRPRRQDMEKTYAETGSMYGTRYNHFLKTKNRISGKIKGIEVSFEESLEVDTPEEFKVIETYFKKAIIEWEGDF